MAEEPRNALMLCYYFPPILATGVTRSRSFAELLPKFGWNPIVLTVSKCRDPWVKIGSDTVEGIRVERSPEWNLAGLVDLCQAAAVRIARLVGIELKTNHFRDLLCIPDTQIAWLSSWAGIRLARSCDVIYVSCSPFSSALSGVWIKWLSGKPLVTDFRDAWTLNPHTKLSRFHRFVIGIMERIVIGAADCFIVNTDGAAELYRRRYPQQAGKVIAIPNGYDELTPVEAPPDPAQPFRIMHVGNFYGSRSPKLLLEVLSELSDCDIEFIQVGGDFAAIEPFRAKVRITVTKSVPRAEALRLMTTASLLYLKQGWEPGVSDYIAVAAKTYEYIATGLPILAEVPPGDNAEIVRRYAGKSWVVGGQDRAELKQAVLEAYKRRLEPPTGITEAFTEKFARANLTRQLTEIFDRVAAAKPK